MPLKVKEYHPKNEDDLLRLIDQDEDKFEGFQEAKAHLSQVTYPKQTKKILKLK